MITQLLKQASQGDTTARAALLDTVYRELRLQARRLLLREHHASTLTPTALVNDLYLDLFAGEPVDWQSREHFFGYAQRAMAHLLVDHFRQRNRQRSGGGWQRVDLGAEAEVPEPDQAPSLAAIDQALATLAAVNPRAARVLELRCLAGLDVPATASLLQVSERTVCREWDTARALVSQMLLPGIEIGTAPGRGPGSHGATGPGGPR